MYSAPVDILSFSKLMGTMLYMKGIIHVAIGKSEGYYTAECSELAVVTQAETLDDLVHNLREALAVHLTDEDLKALGFKEHPAVLASFELEDISSHGQI